MTHFGIGKLMEETGELITELGVTQLLRKAGRLQQLLGKAIAMPVGPHWDQKGEIRVRLMNELADTAAAIRYFQTVNYTAEEQLYMEKRTKEKLDLFFRWGLTGVPVDTIQPK